MRQIPGGQVVCSFGMATNLTWTDSSGQKQNKVEFHNIVAWRKLAEICGQYLKKGSKAYVEGRIQTRDWEGEDGVKRYRTEIVAENMIMLDRREAGGGSGGNYAGASSGADSEREAGGLDNAFSADAMKNQEDVKIDDLPF